MVLQLCPHDAAPFGDLCHVYVKAAALLDIDIQTIFLGPPADKPLPFARYLNVPRLSDGAAIRSGLKTQICATPDLVIAHRYRSMRAALGCGIPAQNIVTIAHEPGMLRSWRRRAHRALFARRVRFAGISDFVAAELAAVTGTMLVLPNAMDIEQADLNRLSPDQAALRLGIEPSPVEHAHAAPAPLTVGVVGRLHYKKRPQLAVAAFSAFKATHPGARLVFVGGGDGSVVPQDQPDIVCTGEIERASEAFAALDILLHTGQVDAFAMVALEAMLAGVPVVSLAGSGPEFVLGPLGYYAASDDANGFATAMAEAVHADRVKLLSEGHTRAQRHFSLQAVADNLRSL